VSELLRAYVPLAVRRIDDHSARFYGRDTEGGWQNRLARAWGRLCSTASPWLVFDRESVLGFAHDPDSEKFFKPLAEPYLHLKNRLQREDPKRWGKPKHTLIAEDESAGSETKNGNPPIASELDFLALDASGQLVCIELKRSKNASGIYWGPLQAGLYRDAFRRALPAIRGSMQNLIRQKLSLGLLPASAERGLREHSLRSVTAALIIAEPNERSTCWEKLAYVQSHLEPDQRVPVYGVTGWGLEDIEIRRRP
jgi:predicted DNA-binding WGR domain protein